jgi:hypothetical protein
MGRRKVLGALAGLCVPLAFPKLMKAAPARQSEAAGKGAAGSFPSGSRDVEQVVRLLEERNRERAAALRQFEGRRVYRMHYQGFLGTREAEMTVRVDSTPDERQFEVESQSGSKFVVDHVFKKLLEAEKEAASEDYRRKTALSTDNYQFTVADTIDSSQPETYILNVTPKTDEKYLYRGKIWVDAKDFAVVRIEAEPAKSPSVWVKKTEIKHKYEKIEDFWLPEENRTDSAIRFGGHALLSIEYKDYKIIEASSVSA